MYDANPLINKPSTGTPIFMAGRVHAIKTGKRAASSVSGSLAIDAIDDVGRSESNSETAENFKQRMPVNHLKGRCHSAAD